MSIAVIKFTFETNQTERKARCWTVSFLRNLFTFFRKFIYLKKSDNRLQAVHRIQLSIQYENVHVLMEIVHRKHVTSIASTTNTGF